MAGGLESIMQGVITQGTALQSKVRQTSQDIIADAYEQYSGSSSARIANNKIDLSENTVDDYTLGSSLLEEEYSPDVINITESDLTDDVEAENYHNQEEDDDDDCCHQGWQRDDHRGHGKARGRDKDQCEEDDHSNGCD